MTVDPPPDLPSPSTYSVARSSMRRDVTAAYVAAGARIAAWAIVSAIVYRLAGPVHFAMLALIRGTIGILNYTSVGLAPALIRLMAENLGRGRAAGDETLRTTAPLTLLAVEPTSPIARRDEGAVFSTAVFVALASAVIGLLLTGIYAVFFDHLHIVPPLLARQTPWAVLLIGLGTLLRLFSDTSGALLQTRGRIALDNYLLAASDAFWAVTTLGLFFDPGLLTASLTYAAAALFLLLVRSYKVSQLHDTPWPPARKWVRRALIGQLLTFGSFVLIAQLAEYFYAPTDYILINHFLSAADVAAYAPGVQIDLGLLMLVTGVAAVLLPRAALAHTSGAVPALRRYYVKGTLASTLLLAVAAAVVWFSYPLIFRIWFGPHPPNTGAILHLVLAGTLIGGSSAVGRSVLIGMGRVKAFTAAAIVAGAANVVISYCLVKYARLGLPGILYGTLAAVMGRCAVWMPWYVLRVLREQKPC
jgi:O-antigen/teichoic acid export membrane protein